MYTWFLYIQKEVKTLLEKNYSNHNLYRILKITLWRDFILKLCYFHWKQIKHWILNNFWQGNWITLITFCKKIKINNRVWNLFNLKITQWAKFSLLMTRIIALNEVVFEKRNKEYGAYALRNEANVVLKRLYL